MRIRTLFLYLTGDRRAILELAADRSALWIGLAFVLSAGFAREYDGADLLREPWHLVIPVGASLVAASLLFLVVCGRLFLRREPRPPFLATYRSFLTLFWLTAPLAWLYAVPYERFLEPGDATRWNLFTLAVVAAWRVVLMVRVTAVLTGRSHFESMLLVMAFADAVALLAVTLMPKPIVSFMGGVRLTESEAAVQGATMLIFILGLCSAPIWGIGGLLAFFYGKPTWQVPASNTPSRVPGRAITAMAAASLLVWLPILPWTQSEQRLRSQVERAMQEGRIGEGLDVLSRHLPSDFPPHWDPPPRIGYHETSPHILDVMESIVARDHAPWVRTCYVEKLRRFIGGQYRFAYNANSGTELAQMARILHRIPEGSEIAKEIAGDVKMRLSETILSSEDRDNFSSLLNLAEKSGGKANP